MSALKRRTRLAPGKRLRRVGARAEREREALLAFQDAVMARAHGACERCMRRKGVHAHHLLPRSRGGKHTLENGAALCARCHGAIHDHTAEDWRKWVR